MFCAAFTERIHADKGNHLFLLSISSLPIFHLSLYLNSVARSELEVSNRNILDAKNQELAGSKTEVAGLKTELETLRILTKKVGREAGERGGGERGERGGGERRGREAGERGGGERRGREAGERGGGERGERGGGESKVM